MPYTHGHHESVLRSHTWRTAGNSAGYLLAHLHPGQSMLDVGCGPGTITSDLARIVDPGRVIGLDSSAEVVALAQAHAVARGLGNVGFEVGDLRALPHGDACFDVVHAHQVLQHLVHPVAALVGLRRVLRPGGTLAVRDSDYGGFRWAPGDSRLTRWLELYLSVTERSGHDAQIGPSLAGLAHAAGFEAVTVSSSTWTFADPEARAWWGGLWADRVRSSRFALLAVEYGLSDVEELESISDAFLHWAASPDGVFITPHVEILAVR